MKIAESKKDIFHRFTEKPEKFSDKQYLFFILSNYLYLLFLVIHFSFI
jgi:hypothetical protein